jgi:hypothetical protein
VTEELRAKGVRTLVPHREIVVRTKAHLEAHPELYEQALERASQMGMVELAKRNDRAHGDRRKRRPVSQTDRAKTGTEIATQNLQLRGD